MNNQESSNMQITNELSESQYNHELMEEKLPSEIIENVLLEGIDSQELLQNVDIVTFSNILADLRYDLATILNEEIDEFQFQTICQDLLAKTSENIKIKSKIPNKSQSQQPKLEKKIDIDIDDIYAHLKRQQRNQLNIEEIDDNVHTKGNEEVIMGLCDENQLLFINNNNKKKNEDEPGSIYNVQLKDNEEEEEEDNDDNDGLINNNKITLMGGNQNENEYMVKFENIPKCYHNIFNQNVANNEIKLNHDTNNNEITPNHDTNNEFDENHHENHHENDNENYSLIVSNTITFMGHETIQ